MKAIKTILAFILVAMFASIGAHAAPITVEELSVEDNNGEYSALVTLANGATGDELTELTIGIDELGTAHQEIVKVPRNTSSQIENFDLQEVVSNYDSLKRGETYTLTISTDDGSEQSQPFLFKVAKDTEGLDVIVEKTKVNSVEIAEDDVLQVLNGETVNVELQLYAQENVDDARFRVFVEGYEHGSLLQSTEIFSVKEGNTYIKTLSMKLPSDMESQKEYKLRIEGANDLSGLTYKENSLYVDTQRNRVDILDLVTTPSSGVEPGQNLIANVRLKNRGQESQDSVKVTVSVPELGVSGSSYVSNIEFEEVTTSDDMLLLVPEEAEAGQYEAQVRLTYNDGYTRSVSNYTFNVLEPREVPERNLLVSFNNNIDLGAGEARSFDVVIGNPNEEAKPISLSGSNNVWADVEVSPSLSMIAGGEDSTYTVTVTPKSEVSGEKTLSLVVKEGSEVVDTIEINTYVEQTDSGVNLLQLLLGVLIVIGIIILIALIAMIAKKKNNREEETTNEEFDSEEYY